MSTTARVVSRIAAVAVCYAAAAWLSGALTLPPDTMASLRPPNALVLAAALLAAPNTWWLYPLATIPGNPSLFDPNVDWPHALGFATANVVEVGVGLALLWLALGRPPRFNRLVDCGVFVIGAAGAGPMVGATIGAATVHWLGGYTPGFWATWRVWTLGDALAMVAFVPVIVQGARSGWWRRMSLSGEAALVFAGLLAVSVPALTGAFGDVTRFPAITYVPLPFLFWAALRLGVVESALAFFVFSGVVLGSALSRTGAFAGLSTNDAVLSMQTLLLIVAVPQLVLAAVVDERRQGEARFRMLFRATPDVITITSLRDGRLIDFNESFERSGGFTREQAIGRTATDLGFWTEAGGREAFMAEVQARGRVRNFLLSTVNASGVPQYGLLSSERVELDGEEVLITVRRDVTDQRRADQEKSRIEEQLQQARKMEAVGLLAGGIAHDFNNLLQAIRGYTEVASGRLPDDHPAQAPMSQVALAADQAATLTGQLLTFSRREALKPQPVDLNAVVDRLVAILRRLIGDHIELRVDDTSDQPAMLADRSQVEQVIMNLCLNSRDAMPNGGRITIRTGAAVFNQDDCRTRPWARPGQWVWLSVADEGQGIAPDVLPRIFEPFFTTKSIERGTGLGLATVFAVVERHGGLLSVDSVVGKGATFTVYFPVATGVTPPAEPMAVVNQLPGLEPRGSGAILVAEDEPFVRELVVEFLETAGYRVIVACDGVEADAIVRGPSPLDLALLDVAMPHRNGRQVFDTIRQVRPALPVVFTSGYSFGELTDLEPIEGQVLAKPYSRDTLLSTIRSAMESRGA